MANAYVERVIEQVKKDNPGEVEYHNTVTEILRSLAGKIAEIAATQNQYSLVSSRFSKNFLIKPNIVFSVFAENGCHFGSKKGRS